MRQIQIPSFIMPLIPDWNQFTGLEVETVGNLVTHISIEFLCDQIKEKSITVMATEMVAAGVPGPLWCWIELSPYPTTTTGVYWAAIGGGGGAMAPVVPLIEAGTGVPFTVHTFMLNWNIHSEYARLIIQTPVAAWLPAAFWTIQAFFSGQG